MRFLLNAGNALRGASGFARADTAASALLVCLHRTINIKFDQARIWFNAVALIQALLGL
ncbi:hypothetical protein [Noviherbaspirillum sp.]|uniref:hypothetical protein n=1 Tax=Noviherbaspirillum sp. TaxID=1926288 RepID=UPI002FE12F21